MFTKTTATTSPKLTEDSIILNQQQESSGDNVRFQNCLSEGKLLRIDDENDKIIDLKWSHFSEKIGFSKQEFGHCRKIQMEGGDCQ